MGGTYRFDFAVDDGSGNFRNFKPGDRIGVNWPDEDGDNTSWGIGLPNYYLQAEPSQDKIYGRDWPSGTTVTVDVEDPATQDHKIGTVVVEDSPECGGQDCFVWHLEDWDLQSGQTISASDGDISVDLTVSSLEVTRVDVLHDQIAGQADPGSQVIVKIHSQDGLSREVTTGANGEWMVDFSLAGNAEKETATAELSLEDFGGASQIPSSGRSEDGTIEYWSAVFPVDLSASSVAENVAAGSVVGTFSPHFDLPDQNLVYNLVIGDGAGDNASFTLDGDELKILAAPDFETKPVYSIRVGVTDQNALGKSFEEAFSISVVDQNDAPTDLTLSNTEIDENVDDGSVVGTLSAADVDSGKSFTYSLVDNQDYSDNDAFTIDGNTLIIRYSPDFENQNSYTVKIRATNSGGLWFEKAFTISVHDLDEDPSDIVLSAASIQENTPAGSMIGTLSTSGTSGGQTFHFELVSGNGGQNNGEFTIDGTSLKINVSPDYEEHPDYHVRVQATDDENEDLVFAKALVISVVDLNEAATEITLTPDSAQENVAANTQIGTLDNNDPDAGQTFTYALASGGGETDNDAFTVTGAALFIKASPNFEAKSSYSIYVSVHDDGSPMKSFAQVLTVHIQDVNEAPTGLTLSKADVDEAVAAGTLIGTFSASDPDLPAQNLTYQFVAGTNDNSAFTIVDDELHILASPDYETKNSYQILVMASDPQGLSFTKAFAITVNNLGEAPTDVSISSASIAENSPAGSTVGTLSAIGGGYGQTFAFSLVSGEGGTDNSAFSIQGSTLKINASPNYEAQSSYAIRIKATDNADAALSIEKEFTITVVDANEAPTDISLSNAVINENVSAGSLVGILSTTDADGGQTHTYQLVTGGTDNSAFTIVDDELRINASPNFEVKDSYSIRVRTTDSGSLTFEKAFTISIHDLNEAPTGLALSASSVNENVAAGSVVATLSASDPDRPAQTLSYSLAAGTGDTDNAAFSISGTSLKINASPDFETRPSYSILVRVTDNGTSPLYMEKAFTITVNNLNEAPSNLSLSASSITENLAAGTEVGTLSASDPDAGQAHSYSLVSGTGSADNASFTISDASLRIKASPDYETKSSYAIRIRVTDNGSPALWYEKTFTITVTNQVEPPIVTGFSKSGLQDNPISFTAGDFSEHFIDVESTAAGSLTKIQISALPSHGSLKVGGGPALSLNAEIAVDNLGQLTYIPSANYSGSDSFAWKGADNSGYSAGNAQVSLSIGFVARYGLQVNPVGDAKTVKAGTAATYNLALTNTGNISDSYTIALVGSPTWTTTFTPGQVSNLGVNAQAGISVTVTVPANTNGSSVATLKITSTHDDNKSVNVVLTTSGIYTAPPPPSPVLLSVSPNSFKLSDLQNKSVILSGANFTDPMTVKFGSTAAGSVTRTNSSELVAGVPSSLSAGVYTVQACNASAVCTSLPGALTILDNNPLVNGMYPRQGYNDTQNVVMVQGYNLNASTTLSLVGASQQPAGVTVSGSQLQATIPAGLPAGTYDLQACNQGLCATLSGAYTSLDVIKNDFSASDEDLWTAPATIREGNTITLGLNVHRSSGIGLASAQVAFYVNDPSLPANRISPETNPSTSNMAVGSVKSVMTAWTPVGLSGTVKIYAVIDPDGVLTEATRANNTVSTSIQILPRQEEDETAPVINSLTVNAGADFTRDNNIHLSLQASDNSGADGVKKMNLVERQFNTSARQWVVVQETGWMDYSANPGFILTDQGGMHYIQVWVADGAGNTSDMAQAHINYQPNQESITAGTVRIYRLDLNAGESKSINLSSLSGDADMYVWDEDGNLIASSLTDSSIDHVGFVAPVDGLYQVEIYAYSDATYAIDFEAPAVGAMPGSDSVLNGILEKTPRSQPAIVTQNEPLKSVPAETAPIEANQEGYSIYLPTIVR